MIPVDMIVKHNPATGIYGDCFRCCVASILELPAASVPHFMEAGEGCKDTWYKELNIYLLKEHKLNYFEFNYKDQNWLDWNAYKECYFNPFYILSGRSPRDNHSVVARSGQILHDPHPLRTGLIGPMDDGLYTYGFFIKP